MGKWTIDNIQELSNRNVIITGANSGIGYEAAKVLAQKGANVIMAVRNLEKGQVAKQQILQLHRSANVIVLPLDLARLGSVEAFADTFHTMYQRLDLLINNAGVMAPPYRTTAEGFELQFGTNHLGHFALTGRLLPLLLRTAGSRVVTVSSAAHTGGSIDFENLDGTGSKGYSRWRFYGQSKLANLLFAYELERRLRSVDTTTISVACHPGFAATNLTSAGFGMDKAWFGKSASSIANLMAQSARMGALPTLYAATEPDLPGGVYIGPTGMNGMRGYPGAARSSAKSHDEMVARELWSISEQMTGVTFDAIRVRV